MRDPRSKSCRLSYPAEVVLAELGTCPPFGGRAESRFRKSANSLEFRERCLSRVSRIKIDRRVKRSAVRKVEHSPHAAITNKSGGVSFRCEWSRVPGRWLHRTLSRTSFPNAICNLASDPRDNNSRCARSVRSISAVIAAGKTLFFLARPARSVGLTGRGGERPPLQASISGT
jgi:hypothetical protein